MHLITGRRRTRNCYRLQTDNFAFTTLTLTVHCQAVDISGQLACVMTPIRIDNLQSFDGLYAIFGLHGSVFTVHEPQL